MRIHHRKSQMLILTSPQTFMSLHYLPENGPLRKIILNIILLTRYKTNNVASCICCLVSKFQTNQVENCLALCYGKIRILFIIYIYRKSSTYHYQTISCSFDQSIVVKVSTPRLIHFANVQFCQLSLSPYFPLQI